MDTDIPDNSDEPDLYFLSERRSKIHTYNFLPSDFSIPTTIQRLTFTIK